MRRREFIAGIGGAESGPITNVRMPNLRHDENSADAARAMMVSTQRLFGRFVLLLADSVVEKPHGLHLKTYRFWVNARLIS